MALKKHLRRLYTSTLPKPLRRSIEAVIKGKYPRVFQKKGFVFIHIPKTAGKSVCQLIGVSGARHLKLSDYERLLGRATLDKYLLFTVIRHPADRLISAWSYMKSGGNHSREDLAFRDRWILPYGDLDMFIQHALHQPEVAHFNRFSPQVDFLKWQDGSFSEQVIRCRFENLEADLAQLPNFIFETSELPHINASKRPTVNFSELGREVISTFYKEDFTLLGYKDSR